MTVGNIARKYSSILPKINFEKLTVDSPFTFSFCICLESDLKSICCLVFHSLDALAFGSFLGLGNNSWTFIFLIWQCQLASLPTLTGTRTVWNKSWDDQLNFWTRPALDERVLLTEKETKKIILSKQHADNWILSESQLTQLSFTKGD